MSSFGARRLYQCIFFFHFAVSSFQVSIYSHLFSRITLIYNNGKKKKKKKNKGKVATCAPGITPCAPGIAFELATTTVQLIVRGG